MKTDESFSLSALKKRLLVRKEKGKIFLKNRESSHLELKETFNLNSCSQYAKVLASFANCKGGMIVFGVKNAPRLVLGVNGDKFDLVDPKDIAKFLTSHLSPELEWELGTVHLEGLNLGFIYAAESKNKPVMCVLNAGGELKAGAIYYRYNGQTTVIGYAELRTLLENVIHRERQAWMQHLRVISEVGPTNVGVLDTIKGKIFGGGAPLLIDEPLARKLKFIREGSFREREGAPAIRLIGEVATVGAVTPLRSVPVSIDAEDILNAFLGERALTNDDALAYLKEISRQNTQYVPIFFFLRAAGVSNNQGAELIAAVTGSQKDIRDALIARVRGISCPESLGAIESIKFQSSEEAIERLKNQKSAKESRSLILSLIKNDLRALEENLGWIPFVKVFEAITHLTATDLPKIRRALFDLLIKIHTDHFSKMHGMEKSVFRKAVTYLDTKCFGAEKPKRL